MKKAMLLLMALCLTVVAQAQSFRIGPAAGVQFNSPTDMQSKVGFNAGVRGEFGFKDAAKGWFLDAAVMFDAKRWESNSYYDMSTGTSSQWDYRTYGLTVPVNIGYKFAVSKSVSLFAAAGPYVNFGLGGKSEVTTTKTSAGTQGKSTASDNVYSDKLMNRVNWGLDFKVGAEFCHHFQVNVGYELGLNKIFKNGPDSKHRTWTAGVAYLF